MFNPNGSEQKNGKMRKRSVSLTAEHFQRLEDIQKEHTLESFNAAMRFCIDQAYDQTFLQDVQDERLAVLVQQNRILLNFVLMELIKMHKGDCRPLDDNSRDYWQRLKVDIENTLQDKLKE